MKATKTQQASGAARDGTGRATAATAVVIPSAVHAADATRATVGPSAVMADADVANGEAGTLARRASDDCAADRASGRRNVRFRTAAEQGGERVAVVGEFNDWSISSHPMARCGDHFELVVALAPGRYRFRYLVDGHRWENDWCADAYEPNAFGGEDSVVVVAGDEASAASSGGSAGA